MSKKLYTAIKNITAQDIIEYLPRLKIKKCDDQAEWYQLYYNGQGIKRIKTIGIQSAFKMLAGVPYNCDGDTLISFYLDKLKSNKDIIGTCAWTNKYSIMELASKCSTQSVKTKELLMKCILKWMINADHEYDDEDPGIDAIFDFDNIDFDFETFDPLVDFRLVTVQELIDYLPKLETIANTEQWYALKFNDKIVKRVKAASRAAAFKELATVEYRKGRTIINYHYNLDDLSTIQFMLNDAITDEEFFTMRKDDDMIKKFILTWIISKCKEGFVHIERQSDWYEQLSFEVFMNEVKRRAVRNKKLYRVKKYDYLFVYDKIITPLQELLFRGNIWQILLDINNTLLTKSFTIDMEKLSIQFLQDAVYIPIINRANEINELLTLESMMDNVEKYIKSGELLVLQKMTICDSV